MRRRAAGGAGRGTFALALALLLAARPAAAQEWHEAYRSGVAALARGDHARAVEVLRRAVALRPEPGRNVVTYGTNVEPRYFPYLRLAEAYLALGQLEPARDALATSTTWGREPADERQKLHARLDAALEQRRPPTPAATPTPVPVTTLATPTPAPPTTLAHEAPAPAAPIVESPTPRPSPPPPPARVRPEAPDRTQAGHPPEPTPGPRRPEAASEPPTGTLEIVSEPAGSSAYIDDEPVGSTDPESGRLVKTGVPAGSHRVRVAHAGHEDAVREIAVPRGGTAAFQAILRPLPEPSPGIPGGLVPFVVLVIALVAVMFRIARPPPQAEVAIWRPTPRPGSTPVASGAATPSSNANPGVTRDEHGQEWFGDFRLLEMLGRGGMASVYKAERRTELSALKRPLGSFLDDPEFLERFLREAEIGRTLNHPSIVRILDRGEVQGVPYLNMELLSGETLLEFIRRWGAAEPRAAAAIVAQVAEALDFAHSKGVVHRDLKPSNIMLLPGGTAKVMDFGIARARRFDGLTATGAFLGTPEYVAPEMIEGTGSGSDPRSDLYALGVILFELLTGQRPFSGDTPFAILRKHCAEEPPPPSRLQTGIPPELDAIVLRLLRKDPEARPASAEELVVALRDWLNRAA